MLKDFLLSLRGNIRERVTNPFLATFTISFIIINWKVVYAFMFISHDKDVIKEIELLTCIICKYTNWYNLYLFPLLSGLVAPFILNGSKWISRLLHNFTMDNVYPRLFRKFAGKEVVPTETYNNLSLALKSKEIQLDKKDKELTEANTKVEIMRQKTENLESEILKITNTSIKIIQPLHFQTKEGNSQYADYEEITLDNHIIKSINFKFNLKNNYLRVGIKFGYKEIENLHSMNGVKSENSFLIHLTSNDNDDNLYLTIYKDLNQIENINLGFKEHYEELNFKASYHLGNFVRIIINGEIKYTLNGVNRLHREKLLIMAWGDDKPFEIDLFDIKAELAE
jgi:hypothetical protein